MVVVMPLVSGVPVSVVDVVDVVAVRDGDVPATFAVRVIVTVVNAMLGRLALVDVPLMVTVKVCVVDIVDVVAVRDRHVPAALAMRVIVAGVLSMVGHRRDPPSVLVAPPDSSFTSPSPLGERLGESGSPLGSATVVSLGR